MTKEKHYVYSARTIREGLELLNRAKGERSWDAFVNEAVAEHYSLPLDAIAIPPSKFLAERAERKAAKDAEKAKKAAESKAKKGNGKKSKMKVDKPAKKATKKTEETQRD